MKAITPSQFKKELKECSKRGFGIAATLGWLIATFDLSTDKEVDEIVDQIIKNEH